MSKSVPFQYIISCTKYTNSPQLTHTECTAIHKHLSVSQCSWRQQLWLVSNNTSTLENFKQNISLRHSIV